MNRIQRDLLEDLLEKRVTKEEFVDRSGLSKDEIATNFILLLEEAMQAKDAYGVEDAFLLAFIFSFPDDILNLLHEVLLSEWHYQHEEVIRLLQQRASTESIEIIVKAIDLKPKLKYLSYDDYGSYFNKCLWVLQEIGTPEAIQAIELATRSRDPILKERAMYRLEKSKGFSGTS